MLNLYFNHGLSRVSSFCFGLVVFHSSARQTLFGQTALSRGKNPGAGDLAVALALH